MHVSVSEHNVYMYKFAYEYKSFNIVFYINLYSFFFILACTTFKLITLIKFKEINLTFTICFLSRHQPFLTHLFIISYFLPLCRK